MRPAAPIQANGDRAVVTERLGFFKEDLIHATGTWRFLVRLPYQRSATGFQLPV